MKPTKITIQQSPTAFTFPYPKPQKLTKPKKTKKPSRTKLIAKLDELVKTQAKIRDNYTCQKCGKKVEGSAAHGSHVIPVSAGNKLRWDLQNIKCLCYHCHINWWHKNPLEAAEWFKTAFPERWAYLQLNRGMKQYKTFELQQMIDSLSPHPKEKEEVGEE